MFLLSSTPILRIGRIPKLIISIIMDLLGIVIAFAAFSTFLLTIFSGGAAFLTFLASATGLLIYWAAYCVIGSLLYGFVFSAVGFLKPLITGTSMVATAGASGPIIAAIPFMTLWWIFSNR